MASKPLRPNVSGAQENRNDLLSARARGRTIEPTTRRDGTVRRARETHLTTDCKRRQGIFPFRIFGVFVRFTQPPSSGARPMWFFLAAFRWTRLKKKLFPHLSGRKGPQIFCSRPHIIRYGRWYFEAELHTTRWFVSPDRIGQWNSRLIQDSKTRPILLKFLRDRTDMLKFLTPLDNANSVNMMRLLLKWKKHYENIIIFF